MPFLGFIIGSNFSFLIHEIQIILVLTHELWIGVDLHFLAYFITMQVFTVSIIVERIRWLETECVQSYEKTWQLVTMEMIREADFDVQTTWWSRKKTAIGTLFIFIPFYYVSWLDGLRCFRRCFHFIQHIATQSINQTIGFCQITMIITIFTLHNAGEGFA